MNAPHSTAPCPLLLSDLVADLPVADLSNLTISPEFNMAEAEAEAKRRHPSSRVPHPSARTRRQVVTRSAITPVHETREGDRAVLSTWVDADLVAAVDRLAARQGINRSTLLRQAIQEHVALRCGFRVEAIRGRGE